MAVSLPSLDDRGFADILDEARARIVTNDPEWTNHNASDPGITLIELFAWLTEMLGYRADQVPARHVRAFLTLLNGPDWAPGPDVSEDVRRTLAELRRRYRAVTGADYEQLALAASPGIARTRCVPLRDLGAGTEDDRLRQQPGHVSVILVPSSGAQPDDTLLAAVRDALEPRRVLTTRLHVVGPVYAPISAEILLARRPDVRPEAVRQKVVDALNGFLDPLAGGVDGAGWPFGRAVYLSDIFGVLDRIPDVDHTPDATLASSCPPGAARCIPARPLLDTSGEPVGFSLAAHHLPRPSIDEAGIVVATAFVPVELVIGLRPLPVDPERLGAVKAAVKRFLHPLHGGPNGTATLVVTADSVAAVVEDVLGAGQDQPSVELRCDPAHAERRDGAGPVTGVRIQAGELVDPVVTVVAG